MPWGWGRGRGRGMGGWQRGRGWGRGWGWWWWLQGQQASGTRQPPLPPAPLLAQAGQQKPLVEAERQEAPTAIWPGRGPWSYLPPWQRPGWLLGRGWCRWLYWWTWWSKREDNGRERN